ncbi:hypothetical protein [Polaromonas naphthalenivorans]|uniref:Uncharacterized protein n=1 Tax=Polaromonas naphthalenivorans (strain CJ2) TaxID=365044 RepID=A1VPJ9_POLNA|nr:hypothetical protein [Polaromonas naphthalenivorans]ABM37577.1 hypothetical protein Pnap_2269 [Polaromonas naphthalenivorans CJ2]
MNAANTSAAVCTTSPSSGKARTRKFTAPYFTVQATVSIFLGDSTSNSPDAKVRVNFVIWHKEEVYRSGRDWAQTVLRRFGTDQKMLDDAYYEVDVDAYFARDARYVRNPDNEPVEAFYFYDKKDEARLIKQRRLVPESHQDIYRIYDPQPDAAVPAGGAA